MYKSKQVNPYFTGPIFYMGHLSLQTELKARLSWFILCRLVVER